MNFYHHQHPKGSRVANIDSIILLNTLFLVFIGIFMVYSSSAVVPPGSREVALLNDLRYLKKHLLSVGLGFSAMILFFSLPLEFFRRYALVLLIGSVVLLCAVYLPYLGVTVNGARRWLRLPGFTFQPSELVKLAMVVFVAKHLSGSSFDTKSFKSFLIPIIVMGMVAGILLKQPDFGSAFIIGIVTITLLFISGVRMHFMLGLGALLIPVIIKLVMEPYRLKRVLVFLDPWADERSGGFQLIQSFVALGTGGTSGVGIGKSTQKLFFLPESKTDFIFSVIGEEMGLIGLYLVVMLFVLFFVRGMMLTKKIKDGFYYYMATGIVLLIVIQAVLNMAVVTGLMPTKGLPLPFISYGGTSMMVNLAAIGLLLNIAKGGERQDEFGLSTELVKRHIRRKDRALHYDTRKI